MRFENTKVHGIDTAIRSMRMPFQSFDKGDSYWDSIYNDYVDTDGAFKIGTSDMDLIHRLLTASSDGNGAHSKFLRSIHVYTEITAPLYFLQELDTYKIGTVRNSSSLQHIGAKRDYVPNDFELDQSHLYSGVGLSDSERDLRTILEIVNKWREKYKETNDYSYFRIMRQLMPMGYDYTISWTANYDVLRTIYIQRIKSPHRLKEWTVNFANWLSCLPYASNLITYGLDGKKDVRE